MYVNINSIKIFKTFNLTVIIHWYLPNMRRCMFVTGLYDPHPTNTTCFLQLIGKCCSNYISQLLHKHTSRKSLTGRWNVENKTKMTQHYMTVQLTAVGLCWICSLRYSKDFHYSATSRNKGTSFWNLVWPMTVTVYHAERLHSCVIRWEWSSKASA